MKKRADVFKEEPLRNIGCETVGYLNQRFYKTFDLISYKI